jgi:hypothetical protein
VIFVLWLLAAAVVSALASVAVLAHQAWKTKRSFREVLDEAISYLPKW